MPRTRKNLNRRHRRSKRRGGANTPEKQAVTTAVVESSIKGTTPGGIQMTSAEADKILAQSQADAAAVQTELAKKKAELEATKLEEQKKALAAKSGLEAQAAELEAKKQAAKIAAESAVQGVTLDVAAIQAQRDAELIKWKRESAQGDFSPEQVEKSFSDNLIPNDPTPDEQVRRKTQEERYQKYLDENKDIKVVGSKLDSCPKCHLWKTKDGNSLVGCKERIIGSEAAIERLKPEMFKEASELPCGCMLSTTAPQYRSGQLLLGNNSCKTPDKFSELTNSGGKRRKNKKSRKAMKKSRKNNKSKKVHRTKKRQTKSHNKKRAKHTRKR